MLLHYMPALPLLLWGIRVITNFPPIGILKISRSNKFHKLPKKITRDWLAFCKVSGQACNVIKRALSHVFSVKVFKIQQSIQIQLTILGKTFREKLRNWAKLDETEKL